MIRNLAGGSTFLGTIGLIGTLFFYFNPTVEAVAKAADSVPNLQINQTEPIQVQIPSDNITDVSTNKDAAGSTLKAMAFRATAYCIKGKTALGSAARRGFVAADPRILPLGTRIEIQNGAYSGTYTVADTGGAVKGHILDIWVASCAEAIRFGRKSVMVTRLGKSRS